MKIIKEGKIPEPYKLMVVTYTAKCNYCDTEFEFNSDEAELTRKYTRVRCPLCRSDVYQKVGRR